MNKNGITTDPSNKYWDNSTAGGEQIARDDIQELLKEMQKKQVSPPLNIYDKSHEMQMIERRFENVEATLTTIINMLKLIFGAQLEKDKEESITENLHSTKS